MSLSAVKRYVRWSYFLAKGLVLGWCYVWLFVAGYIAIPKLVNLQDFEFVPGYAQCSVQRRGEQEKVSHYAIVLTLILITPLFAATLFTRKFSKLFVSNKQGSYRRLPSETLDTKRHPHKFSAQELDWVDLYSRLQSLSCQYNTIQYNTIRLLYLPRLHLGVIKTL